MLLSQSITFASTKSIFFTLPEAGSSPNNLTGVVAVATKVNVCIPLVSEENLAPIGTPLDTENPILPVPT